MFDDGQDAIIALCVRGRGRVGNGSLLFLFFFMVVVTVGVCTGTCILGRRVNGYACLGR